MIGKDKIERICRDAGMKPVKRDNIAGAEVFIADGFSLPPHQAYRRFGIGPEQFPQGMYATLWWVSRQEDKLDVGSAVFFELFHDPQYTGADKQRGRINAALKDAMQFLVGRKKAMH